ncbi:MAG: hypothetical protein JNG88_08710 [Phycisphaerales bacterium]|nr:hypothetical protein [Phycisphaerales bacterium]
MATRCTGAGVANRFRSFTGVAALMSVAMQIGGCPNDGSGARIVPPFTSSPVVSFSISTSIAAGATAVLDASGTSDADGDSLTFTWEQTAGPLVVISDSTAPAPSFVAPQVLSETTLTFRLRVSDGENTVDQSVSIVINPVPFTGARTSWIADSQDLNADIFWRLPSGAPLDAERDDWGMTGLESIAIVPSVIPNGRHNVSYELNGAGRSGAVAFAADLFNYHFATATRLTGIAYRTLAIDVLNGEALPLFNGWLDAGEAGAGRLTGRYDIELLGAWRNATGGDFHTDLFLLLPSEVWADAERADWAPQGLERIMMPQNTPISDGNYSIVADTNGQGRTAEAAFEFGILNYEFATVQTMLGGERRVIGLDLRSGIANVLFNGWLAADAPGAGGLTAQRPLQAIGAWRDGSGDGVHVDIFVQLPDDTFIDVRRWDWAKQGYEHAYLDGVALPNGVYRFRFELNGAGRTGLITYRAKLLNWQFERTETQLGGTVREIQVQVTNGVATQIASDW